MAMRVALMIDGRVFSGSGQKGGDRLLPDYIEKVARACVGADEECLRIYYYDAPPYSGTVRLPISGAPTRINQIPGGSVSWLAKSFSPFG